MTGDQMRAALYRRRGAAHDVLEVATVPVPRPGAGEVLVRVAYSGINPSDWKVRARTGLPLDDFQVPHHDGSGEVVAVGDGVPAERVGERVWLYHAARGSRWGTACELVPVPQQQAVPLPDGVSLRDAAMFGIPYMTAAASLRVATRSCVGRTVLVQGGAGAVGSATVQLARWSRAHAVIASASTAEKRSRAQTAGAHETVDYTAPDFADELERLAPQGIDHVVELALGTNVAAVARAVSRGAEVVVYGADEGDATLPTRALLDTMMSVRFLMVYNVPRDEEVANARLLNDMFADGVRPVLDSHVHGLDEIVDAHVHAESLPFGRVLVKVDPGA